MRSEGYDSRRVCLSVGLLSHISPLWLLFVVKTLPRTQQATKLKEVHQSEYQIFSDLPFHSSKSVCTAVYFVSL